MAAPPSTLPPLARAHLALADDLDSAVGQHSLPRALVATAAAVALALATPLAWATAIQDEPPAATVVKAADVVEDDESDVS
jgi:hypothetical protein